MDNESRIIAAVQLHKAFDLLLSQPSAMVTSQHRENPQHNNQETCALHLRESALHMAKHLSRGIKQVSCSIFRQSCQNAYKLLLLGNEDFISSAKLCVFSSNWSPPSVPTESIQGTPILENQGCLLNGIQRNGVLTRAWDILVLPTHKPTATFLHKDIWSPHILTSKQTPLRQLDAFVTASPALTTVTSLLAAFTGPQVRSPTLFFFWVP